MRHAVRAVRQRHAEAAINPGHLPDPGGYLVDHGGLRRAQLPPRGAVRKAGYNPAGIRPPGPLAMRNNLGSATP
jgi:hypothetical protein